MGFTLNQITMLALVLVVGIVIDDAIVVLENIFRFAEEKNLTAAQAAIQGTKDIGLAVMATTFSLVIIFLPVAMMRALSASFMSSFGYTAAFAIMVSLLVSFTLTPMLCSRFLKPGNGNARRDHQGHGSSACSPGLPADAALVHGAPLGGGGGGGRDQRLLHAALHDRRQGLPAHRRPERVRGHGARRSRLVARRHRAMMRSWRPNCASCRACATAHAIGADTRRRWTAAPSRRTGGRRERKDSQQRSCHGARALAKFRDLNGRRAASFA
jgi:multidrug efflux pump subunit AcrB